MSPSAIGASPEFGGSSAAGTGPPSIHFLNLCALVAFVLVQTTMVVIHGIPREWAAMVLTSYHSTTPGRS